MRVHFYTMLMWLLLLLDGIGIGIHVVVGWLAVRQIHIKCDVGYVGAGQDVRQKGHAEKKLNLLQR